MFQASLGWAARRGRAAWVVIVTCAVAARAARAQ
jgi:hypothetical protein